MNVETSPRNAAERVEQEQITAAIGTIIEDRAVIEQAKGMLMFVYGINAEAAFKLLRWQSQDHNVKVRHLSDQIVKDLTELHEANPPAQRLIYDRAILTAHARIASQPGTAA